MTEDQVRQFLEGYGQALSTGNLDEIAACWSIPALVLADAGAVAVSDRAQVAQFFAQAVEWYRAQGLVSTTPRLERIEPMGERLAAVGVRWSARDATGAEQSGEHSYYIVRQEEDGRLGIQVALTRPVQA
jgi:hypothetical protein